LEKRKPFAIKLVVSKKQRSRGAGCHSMSSVNLNNSWLIAWTCQLITAHAQNEQTDRQDFFIITRVLLILNYPQKGGEDIFCFHL
jgi:hypothetical protein